MSDPNKNPDQGQEPKKQELFSTESQDANQANLSEMGFKSPIQQVQQSSQPKNPKDFFKNQNDTVIKNIVDNKINPNQETSFSNDNDLLDEFSEIDKRLNLKIDSLEVIKEKKKTSRLIFVILFIVASIVIAASLFFQGAFSSQEVDSPLQQAQVQYWQIKSELILNQTKQASILINQLAFQASDFQKLYNQSISEFETAQNKNKAKTSLPIKQAEITNTLTELKSVLSKAQSGYGSDPTFHEVYTNYISKQLTQAQAGSSTASLSLFETEQLLRDSSKLVKNKDLLASISQSNLEQLTQSDMLNALRSIFKTTNLNYVTDLANFTLTRVELTRMFSELSKVASSFDPNFSPFNIREDSMINFNNYTISANNTVSVTADIKTSDQNLFSLVANLDDAISASPLFQNISRTTYSKNLSPEGEFTSSVNLDINLEEL
jgi:hypothetical protein